MKKLYIAAVCASLALNSFAQDNNDGKQYLHQLNSEIAPDEYKEFFYNANNLADSIAWCDGEHEFSSTFSYDDNLNLIGIQVYQTVDMEQLKTPRFEYDYDDQNRIIERRNFNAFPGLPEMQSGTIKYMYDENGNMSEHTTYLGTDIYDRGEYVYNDKNQLIKETIYKPDAFSGSDELTESDVLEYTYDDQDRIFEIVTKTLNNVGELLITQKTTYVYDENGNLGSIMSYLNRGSNDAPVYYPATQHIFVFDTDTKVEDVVYPVDPEYGEVDIQEAFELSKSKIVGDSIYGEFDGVWGLFDARDFVYTDVRPSRPEIGVEEAVAGNEASMFVLGDRIYLTGVKQNALVQIYDEAGRLVVVTYNTEAGISTANLPEGVKILKTEGLTQKFF